MLLFSLNLDGSCASSLEKPIAFISVNTDLAAVKLFCPKPNILVRVGKQIEYLVEPLFKLRTFGTERTVYFGFTCYHKHHYFKVT